LGAGGAVVGCLLGLPPTLHVLLGGPAQSLQLDWDGSHGPFRVELDGLSAFFLLPVLGLSALAAVYGGAYLFAARHHKSLGWPWFFFNVFVGGMVLVLVARTALLFLVAWEVMSLAAYCLVTFEHEQHEVRQAGWVYLIATHLGVVFVFIAFLLLGRHAGGLDFQAWAAMPALGALSSGVIFLLAVVGFGAKAGFVPFHVWLPEAHPAAPSHVSALMSGVMIKMGLYGILRTLTFLGPPAAWWGLVLAGLGLVTALVGIALALQQRDVKRVLAYSSIENMGLVALALGVGLWGAATGRPALALLGMSGGLLHVWNHALIKGAMFLAAGSVLHGTGTRDMEKLGGLMKSMPWTGGVMVVGAVAIAALPPMNGFVSKWLMYLSLMQVGMESAESSALPALLAVGMLALVGALAAIALVRLVGIALLGAPRTQAAEHAHESSPWMIGPMLMLVALCALAAVAPQMAAGWLAGPVGQLLGDSAAQASSAGEPIDVPLRALGAFNVCTWIALAAVAAALVWLTRREGPVARGPTWGCGYARPTSRMQYTGRSFAEMIAERVLPRPLRPRTSRRAPQGLFPAPGEFGSETPDPVSGNVYEPFFRRWADRCSRLRILQQGKVNVYLFYIMLMVVLALSWASMRSGWWGAP
jgi:formate hydrogenlyase subunit 3/multisubunit Na+/H+ antiporter MnhD subunit